MKVTKETVTSRKNPLVMLAASLSEKKYRDANGLFVANGYKLCREAVATGAPVQHVLLHEEYAATHLKEIVSLFSAPRYEDTVLTVLSAGCFEKISTEKAPEGIILLIKYLDISKKYNKIIDVGFSDGIGTAVMLFSVRDPGNLGAVLRSAGAFGATTVLLSEDCADLYSPRAVRAAMGAVFRVPTVRITNVREAIGALRAGGRRVLAAELRENAVPLSSLTLSRKDVFVIGNEGHGIPTEISALCDGSVYLPIAEGTESLNAAAAATVFLWEQSKCK
ncbi:MAG: RNA methyltransferase [Clostridia bacterium]|nr:RNA methyltransferase [Clostridia bacterium]